MQFVSAISNEQHTGEALDEVLGEVREQLDGEADFVMTFASYHHRRDFDLIADAIERDLNPGVALGATAAAVLGSGQELEKSAGLTMLAAKMPGAWMHPFRYDDLPRIAEDDDPTGMREAIVGEGREGEPAAMFLLADPFSTPMVKLIPAINAALPGVPLIGGMASGGAAAGDNRLLLGGEVTSEGAVGVAIGGDLRVDCTVSQGCRPVGQPWVITKAKHNLIQSIGGRAVLDVIQETAEQADPEDQELLQHGLFVGRVINEYKDRFGRGDFLIRNIVGADQETGYIAVSDLVKVGETIQFHVRDRRTAEQDLRLLLQSQKLHGEPAGALLCTCNGRGLNIFEEPNVESSIIRGELGESLPLAGFFAAGEIGPVGGSNFLHGFTASLAVFRPQEQE